MPCGLQVFDAQGRIQLDTNTRCGRVIGMSDANLGGGSISHGGLSQGTPFAFAQVKSGATFDGNPVVTPICTVSGTTINYTAHTTPSRIIYGVY